ncbi:hypothetical protein [Nostoc sp. UIC 10630]|uniref:hypothetical protein n=1 Tax=Nostoc sp. UIC 10630 TaxID=2100146 RepID=UPI0013CFC369|nr:hypothetical protein [Nostoc sp. UIC 10630]NEU84377.1 hypothetical protein [Nostoc sp. UIC 10630]
MQLVISSEVGFLILWRSLLIPPKQHPINNRNPPLRKLHQQFLDHNPQSRVITPTLLQEFIPRILLRIRRNSKFLHTLQSQI